RCIFPHSGRPLTRPPPIPTLFPYTTLFRSRELKLRQPIPPEQVKKFYDEHPELYLEPGKARVAQILFATRGIPSGKPLPLEQRRSEEHTSELQSRENLVCRLLLEKKNKEKS